MISTLITLGHCFSLTTIFPDSTFVTYNWDLPAFSRGKQELHLPHFFCTFCCKQQVCCLFLFSYHSVVIMFGCTNQFLFLHITDLLFLSWISAGYSDLLEPAMCQLGVPFTQASALLSQAFKLCRLFS